MMFKLVNKMLRMIFLFLVIVISAMNHHAGSVISVQHKIDPVLREILLFGENESRASYSSIYKESDDDLSVDVFIRTTDPEILKEKGVCVHSVIGDLVTAVLPLSMVRSVAELTEVSYIEASSVCRLLLDKSIPEIGVDHVWNGDLGSPYKGEGVIVGIYDSGIDWSHQDFINANGESRILYLWDQTADAGPHPDGYPYGTEYTQSDINNEIDGTPAGVVQGRDFYGHGTHVAGIAVGNGRAGSGQPTYIGVAPEADLIVVKGGNETGYIDVPIIDGINYIFQKAEAMNPPRPAVVNLSVGGTHRGPHDGTSFFETSLDNLLNGKPGRAVVVAAGNDGDQDIHFKDDFSYLSNSDTVEFQVGHTHSGEEDYIAFDIWYDNFVDLSATVMTPEDSTYGPFQNRQNKIYGTRWGRIVVTVNDDETNMHLRISDRKSDGILTDSLVTGVWKLILTGKSGQIDGWLYESTMNAQITSDVDYSTLINEPGNARFCITVGSYISRLEWPHQISKSGAVNDSEIGALSDFSSPGPIRNGYSKPDIVAPGEYIVSSFSSDGNLPSPEQLTPDGLYRAWEGTSMAAPHVTGVIALMFQANPELSTSEIKTIFMNTAKRDDFTGYELWNYKRGYGKLDAIEAVRMSKTPVRDGESSLMPESIVLSQNYPNPFNGSTAIEYTIPDRNGFIKQNVILELFDMTGRKVRTVIQKIQAPGHYQVSWEGLDDQELHVSSGIYVYRLQVDQIILSKKLIYLR